MSDGDHDGRRPVSADDLATRRESIDGSSPAPLRPRLALREGEVLDRYLVIEIVGSGAMGVVARAYDPKLRREVALKLVRAEAATLGSTGPARLLREAQALAQLSHPNVVTAYDAGTVGDDVYIAMEYVEGETLASWSAEEHPWREVLAVLDQAARGLAAAHAAGLVHRDFKPANVLIGKDGRVRVSDFGLARPIDGVADEPVVVPGIASEIRTLAPLTEVGMVMGTPAYMAPEQHVGTAADARSDQYAFCVTAWESLHGARPFTGKTMHALLAAKRAHAITARRAAVPRRFDAVLLRGMDPEPTRRHADVAALLRELRRDPWRRRRQWLAAAAVIATVAGVVAWPLVVDRRERAACDRQAEGIAAIWTDDARARVRDGLVATGAVFATTTADRVTERLDGYAQQWAQSRREQCLVHRGAHERSAEIEQAAADCFDDRARDLAALAAVLAGADAEVVQRAVLATATLVPLDACADEASLLQRARTPEDPAQREQTAAIRGRLATVRALHHAARYTDAQQQIGALVDEAEATGWLPLVAEARTLQGRIAAQAADADSSERALEAAVTAAIAGSDDAAAADAMIELVRVAGYDQVRPDDGLRWAAMAGALLERIGGGDTPRAATLADYTGIVHDRRGRYDEGYASFLRALEIRERLLGPEHPEVASSLNHLGHSAFARSAFDDARLQFESALAILESTLGADHPGLGTVLTNLGVAYETVDRLDDSERVHLRALALRERGLAPDHPDLAISLTGLGNLVQARGRAAEAFAYHQRALAIFEKILAPDHPDIAVSLVSLGKAARAQGDHDAAVGYHERALVIFEKALGPDHHHVGATLANLGRDFAALGDHEQAILRFERARAVFEKTQGAEHLDVADALAGIATAELARGKPHRAIDAAERALRIAEKAGAPASLQTAMRTLLDQARAAASSPP